MTRISTWRGCSVIGVRATIPSPHRRPAICWRAAPATPTLCGRPPGRQRGGSGGRGTDEVQTSLAVLSIAGYANVERLDLHGDRELPGHRQRVRQHHSAASATTPPLGGSRWRPVLRRRRHRIPSAMRTPGADVGGGTVNLKTGSPYRDRRGRHLRQYREVRCGSSNGDTSAQTAVPGLD